MPTLIFHGHACWEVQGEHRLLIDPFLAGNPVADVGPEHFDTLDAILLSHGHVDHIGDTEAIARASGALIVANYEIASHFAGKGLATHPLHIGGGRQFPFGYVKLTIAHHGSTGPNGEAFGNPAGIILHAGGKRIYHAGDTGVFLDMQLIAELNGPFDAALLPIGDNFTMGIDDAVKATEFIGARMHLPMHFGTFEQIDVDPQEFRSKAAAVGQAVTILEPGGRYAIP